VITMRLTKALGVKRNRVVSFVGAGGKTTAMFRLAEELIHDRWKVVTTTTTMLRREQRSEHTILESDHKTALEKARSALTEHNHITLAASLSEAKGKLTGIAPETVDALIAMPGVDGVIVEADGAKGRSLKAPAPYEPVIPQSTAILVPVAAVDAVGQPLDEDFVHRPEIVAGLVGAEMGQIISPQMISTVLLHADGGLKSAPPEATIIPLINKVSEDRTEAARDIARTLLESTRVERVLLAAVAEEEPVKEAWGRVAAVVLAAGGSSRFGSPKQLLAWKGKTLLEHVVDTALESSVQQVVVVLGHEAPRIGALLGHRSAELVVNAHWAAGQSSSIRTGLQAVQETCEACLFILADQPNLTSALLDQLVARYRRTLAPIVAPVCRGRRGNPVLFSRALFRELLHVRGDQGGRQVMRHHEHEIETLEVADESLFLDIDTVDDYERAK